MDVRDNPSRGRFELIDDGATLGFAEYHETGGLTVMPHTVIDPRHRGRGLGAVLATAALDELKARGASVIPQCWFVRDVIAANPADYLAMVPVDRRAAFDLPMEG